MDQKINLLGIHGLMKVVEENSSEQSIRDELNFFNCLDQGIRNFKNGFG